MTLDDLDYFRGAVYSAVNDADRKTLTFRQYHIVLGMLSGAELIAIGKPDQKELTAELQKLTKTMQSLRPEI